MIKKICILFFLINIFFHFFTYSGYAFIIRITEMTQIGSWNIYRGWIEGSECSCGATITDSLGQSWSVEGGIGISLDWFEANLSFSPPDPIFYAQCVSSKDQFIVLYYCEKKLKVKFHEEYYQELPFSGGPFYDHPIINYNLWCATQREKLFCPQKPWTHPCHVHITDKDGKQLCCIEKPECNHGIDKDNNKLPCPFPILNPPEPLQSGSEPSCYRCINPTPTQ